MQKLHEKLSVISEANGDNFYKNKVDKIIFDNLRFGLPHTKEGSEIRPYQKEAFGRFIYYTNEYQARPKGVPIQLLFHMATGSGKTLIMAGLIIHLYNKGYRNFLFFVNSNNIIQKTRENFLNPNSPKYLFSDVISINGKQIRIKEVENFQAVNQDDINIVFSTIQMLHFRLNTPKENAVTYGDFEDKKIVLISDEAHHINVETRRGNRLSVSDQLEIESWESTVNRIFQSNSDNLLLEFTATADLSDQNILEKYNDKIIFDYPLKQFRIDGYSKEVKLLQADLEPFERALQGIILSQYRRKIFEKHKIRIKPVILFKSKTINESETFFQEFLDRIKKLKPKDIEKIYNNAIKYETNQVSLNFGKSNAVLSRAFKYFKDNNISFENLIDEFQNDFSENKCISVNSKSESESKQISVNTLEDENNEYRAIFAVDMLNEGWDVLNLFDIIRLYETRDFNQALNRPGKTTMSEAQLIGRGARYYPFRISSDQPLYQRKYDQMVENELKICEELYYHSSHNPRYISELNIALTEIGITPKEVKERELKLKDSFQNTDFFKTSLIYLNEKLKYDRSDIFSLDVSIIPPEFKFHLRTGLTQTTEIFEEAKQQKQKLTPKKFTLNDFGIAVIRKAIDKLNFYCFDNLKSFFPNLNSISEFITSENYLGKIKNILIEGTKEQIENITPEIKLQYSIEILETLQESIQKDKIEYKGSKKFTHYFLKDKIEKYKLLNFAIDDNGKAEFGKSIKSNNETALYLDVSQKNWFVYDDNFGTSEEKHFIHFIDITYEKLNKKYKEIYLVRNERFFKLYNFDDGRAIEPDFVLYLVNQVSNKSIFYQVFVEPKGDQFKDSDGKFVNSKEGWKQQFLLSLKNEHQIEMLWKDKEYVVWGMPFYNKILESDFEDSFDKNLLRS